MKHAPSLLALLLAGVLLLSGCGTGTNASTSVALPSNAPSSDTLRQLTLGDRHIQLEPEQSYSSWSADGGGTELRNLKELTVVQDWEKETLVTHAGIGLGATIEAVLTTYDIQPQYARLTYEADPQGDGDTEVTDVPYLGTLPDWDEQALSDLCLCVAYAPVDGNWEALEQSTQSASNYAGAHILYDFGFIQQDGELVLGDLTVSYYTAT